MYTLFEFDAMMPAMEASSTALIVQALTKAIVEHRLQPGSKLIKTQTRDRFLTGSKPLNIV